MKSESKEAFAALVAAIIAATVNMVLGGLVLRGLISMIHDWWVPEFPTLTFWHAFWIYTLFRALVGLVTSDYWSKDDE